MSKSQFDDDWKIWIWSNVQRGCSKDGVFKILIDEGFSFEAIREELNYAPSISLDKIRNPLQSVTDDLPAVDTLNSEEFIDNKSARSISYLPNATRFDSKHIELWTVEEFLNKDECNQLVKLIKTQLRASTITREDESDKHFRTSKTCDLGLLDDALVTEIDRRICRYLGVSQHFSEMLQGQHYEIGEEFKLHTDFFEVDELEQHGASQGQRTWTFMIYLNTTVAGGETHFPKLAKSFVPRIGRAVIWNNLCADGGPNSNTVHHGMAPISGDKTIITKWFRQRGQGKMLIKEPNEYVPSLTAVGFEKIKMPAALFATLREYYCDHAGQAVEETVEGFIDAPLHAGSELVELPVDMKRYVHRALQPLLENWCGAKLEATYVYGIRRYKNGATLKRHYDRIETHHLSAVLNIDQDVDQDWPLEIDDHYYRLHQVVMSPGDMLFYEGGRLKHGRPTPMRGRSYANAFVHFKLVGLGTDHD